MRQEPAGESDNSLRKYFLDTYAMIEYLRGNPNYSKYFSNTDLSTSIMNLAELYFLVLREHDEEKADKAYSAFRHYQKAIEEQDVRNGMKLRLRVKLDNIDISYADAIGYAMSEHLGALYLTGDSAFKKLPNVEFVK
jgi:predicted nucleic acid-binding protein